MQLNEARILTHSRPCRSIGLEPAWAAAFATAGAHLAMDLLALRCQPGSKASESSSEPESRYFGSPKQPPASSKCFCLPGETRNGWGFESQPEARIKGRASTVMLLHSSSSSDFEAPKSLPGQAFSGETPQKRLRPSPTTAVSRHFPRTESPSARGGRAHAADSGLLRRLSAPRPWPAPGSAGTRAPGAPGPRTASCQGPPPRAPRAAWRGRPWAAGRRTGVVAVRSWASQAPAPAAPTAPAASCPWVSAPGRPRLSRILVETS